MRTPLALVLAALSLCADPIVSTRPRVMMDALRVAELASYANSSDAGVRAKYDSLVAALAPYHPYNGSLSDLVGRGQDFALLYQIDKQPFGGTRNSYADLAKRYAVRTIETALSGLSTVNLRVIAMTNDAQPELIFDKPHGLAVDSDKSVVVAGGMGAYSQFAGAAYVMHTDATDPNKARLTACSTVYAYTPCVLSSASLGAFVGQDISVFLGNATTAYPSNLGGIHGGNQARYYDKHLARIYDWAKDGMIADTEFYHLRNYGMYQAAMWNARVPAACTPITIGSNLCMGYLAGAMMWAQALGGDWDEPGSTMDAQTLYDSLRSEWGADFLSTITSGYLKGGQSYEGAEYGPQTLPMHLEVAETIRTGTGEDVAALVGDWPSRIIDALLHNTSSLPAKTPFVSYANGTNRYEPAPFSDLLPSNQFKFSLDWIRTGVIARALVLRNGRTADAEKISYWMNNLSGESDTGAAAASANFLWQVEGVNENNDYRLSLPLQRLDAGLNILSARDSFTSPTATWTYFTASPVNGAHAHGATGDFGINRKGYWLTKEWTGWGTKAASGAVHNTPIYGNIWPQIGSTAEGDASISTYDDSDASYTYAKAAMQKPFRCPHTGSCIPTQRVNTATRYFFYFRPSLVIVADTVNYLSPQPSRYTLHFRRQPSIAGNTITYTEGDQQLTATVVAPASMGSRALDNSKGYLLDAVSAGNGNTFLFTDYNSDVAGTHTFESATGGWVALTSGVSVPAKNGSNTGVVRFLRQTATLDSSGFSAFGNQVVNRVPSQFTRILATEGTDWRTEYWDGVGVPTLKLDDASFTVLEAHDSSGSPTAQAPITVTSGNWHGRQINGSYNIVVMAPNSETVNPTLTYTYGASVALTHHLLGLTPNTAYDVDLRIFGTVSITPCSGCMNPISTNAAGMLRFGTTAGGSASMLLSRSPSTLTFSCVAGSNAPVSQDITVNTTAGVAAYTATNVQSWLSLSGATGTTTGTVTATASCPGTPGVYTDTITISSDPALVTNSPLTVAVTLTAIGNMLSRTPSALTFSAQAGGSNPPAQDILIAATSPVDVTVSHNATWLSCSPSSGTVPITTTCTPSVGALPVGLYNATVTITASGSVTNSTITVPVSLSVTAPTTTLSSDSTELEFTAVLGGAAPTTQHFEITASPSNVEIDTVISDPHGIFSITPSGTIAPVTYTVGVDHSTLFPGVYTATVSLNPKVAGPGIEVPLSLNVTPSGHMPLSVRSLSRQAIMSYGAAALSASQTCTLRVLQPPATELSRVTDSGGSARRQYVWSTPILTPSSIGNQFEAICGTIAGSTPFDTRPSATGLTIMTVSSHAIGSGASTMRIHWGYTPALSEPVVTALCVTGRCKASVPVLRDRVVYYRREFLNSAGIVVAGPSAITMQEVR